MSKKKNKYPYIGRPKIEVESFKKEIHDDVILADVLKEVTDLGVNPRDVVLGLYWTDYEAAHIVLSSYREETDEEYKARLFAEDEKERKHQERLAENAKKMKEKLSKEEQIEKLQDEVAKLTAELKRRT